MKKSICILGSTGSIGVLSLDIVNKKKKFFQIYALLANKNYNLILKQIKKYKPKYYIISDKKVFKKVKKNIKIKNVIILNNLKDIISKKKINITISAIPGIAGLEPTLKMIKLSKKLLIANKESIICGWNLIYKCKTNNTKIIPIDLRTFLNNETY